MESTTKIKLTIDKLDDIAQKTFNEGCESFKELSDGWFNTAYDIALHSGRQAILKIAPPSDVPVLSYEKDIMKTEVEVMRMVRGGTDVPVPEIYTYDISREIIDNDYYMMEKLRGVPYNYIENDIDEDKKYAIESKLGEYTRQINSISGKGYGFYSDVYPKFDDFYEGFTHMVSILLQDARALNVDIMMPYEKVLDIISQFKGELRQVKRPSLVHWDLWAGNFFVDDARITGIIDFERALWGEGLMELFFYFFEDNNYIKGYGNDLLKSPGSEIRRKLYAFYMGIILVVETPYRGYDDAHMKWAMDNLKIRYENIQKFL